MSDADADLSDGHLPAGRKRSPYNKGACRQCGVAKTKCIPIPGNPRCERCEKLNRECNPRTPTHRKRRSAPATTARVANLEQKLDSIVSLLSTSKESSAEQVTPPTVAALSVGPEPTPDYSSPDLVQSNGCDAHASLVFRTPREGTTGLGDTPSFLTEATPLRDAIRPATTHNSSASTAGPRDIHFQDAELDEVMRRFRGCCAVYFPFVIVPPEMSFAQGQKVYPFLFDAISFVAAAKDFRRQAALGEKLLEDIVNRSMLRPEKTEELLAGMLLFTTWHHIMLPINGQMTTLQHMMKALIVNLQYDRPSGSVNRRLLFMKGFMKSQVLQMAMDAPPRSPSEQRAVLGCYYLTSVKCMLSGSLSMDHFEFYPYMQACATSLEELVDQPTDVMLAHLVRLQGVVDKINKLLPRGDNPGFVDPETTVPTYMAMKALQADLAERKAAWPEPLRNDTTLLLQYYAAEVFLYETTMIDFVREKSPMDRLQTLEMLNNCLVAIQSYLALYRAIPQWEYAYVPFTTWMQSGLVLQAAMELLFFEQIGWDLPSARAQLDLISFVDFEMSGIQAVINTRRTNVEGLDNRDIFLRFLRRKGNMKKAYQQRIAAEQQQALGNAPVVPATQDWIPAGDGAFPVMEEMYMGGLPFGFENAFWQDFSMAPGAWALPEPGLVAPEPAMAAPPPYVG